MRKQQSIKLGVIGCGDIARYVGLLSKVTSSVRITACCDVDTERAKRFSKIYGISEVTGNYRELVALPELDAVYVAVPHHLHYEITKAAVDAGKDVLLEKPLAHTLEDAEKIVALATQSGRKIGVNYQYRYDVGCYRLAQVLRNGLLGEIYSVRINVPWHRDRAYFEQAPWHKELALSGGGTLLTQGSHFLDVVLWALGEQPILATGMTQRRVFIHSEVEDIAQAIVQTKPGTLIQINSMMISAVEGKVEVEVYGERGIASYTDRPFPHTRFIGVHPSVKKMPVKGVHALQRSLKGFAAWLFGEHEYHTPANDALPVMIVVDAIYRSAQTGQVQTIDWEND